MLRLRAFALESQRPVQFRGLVFEVAACSKIAKAFQTIANMPKTRCDFTLLDDDRSNSFVVPIAITPISKE